MRIVGCGLVAVAALLGPAPAAMATQPAAPESASAQTAGSAHTAESTQNTGSTQHAAAPESEVSLLAVTLTAGGAIAAAGSGMALVVTRRREVSRRPSRESA